MQDKVLADAAVISQFILTLAGPVRQSDNIRWKRILQ